MKPFKDVVVSVPEKVAYKQAERILRENIDWVRREKSRMRDVEAKCTVFEPGMKVKVKDRVVRIEHGRDRESETVGKVTTVYVSNSDAQSYIRFQVEEVMRSWCKDNLVDRAYRYAENFDVPLNNVSIRKTYTRWGSFSDKNNLNLSIYLATVPDHLIDYVILHELAHHKIRNHSKAY